MKSRAILITAILVTLGALLCIFDLNPTAIPAVLAALPNQPNRQGAWLDSIVFTEQGDPTQAVAQLQANALDVYAYPVVDADLFQAVLEDPNLAQTESYGSYTELTFNPHGPTFYDGRLNPFSNAKIREAMNWLVDRNKIAQEIYGGMATPKWLPLAHIDADYYRFQSTIAALETQYAYNFSQAHSAITTEMEGMGAVLQNGAWYYNGLPVTVIFLIRVEDQRRMIGDYVSDQLEAVGFQVDRQYKTRNEASPIWNQSDPGEGQWHIYTGGWISTSNSRDDGTNFGYFYTPLGSGGPLWDAYQPTSEYMAVSEKLWTNNFSTLAERASLFTQALGMAMNDNGPGSEGAGSVRVWLVDSISFSPRRVGTTVASDLAGGLETADAFPYVARFDGSEGGSMRIAQPAAFFEPWNPVAGSNWVFDMMTRRTTEDRGLMTDPNTGLFWPLRIESADVIAKEGLPVGKTLDWVNLTTSPSITVPSDAWVDWDAASQTFVTAGEKYTQTLTANSKVTVYYPADLFTTVRWQDGNPISVGDFVLSMILQFDRAKPGSPIYDESTVPQFDYFMSHFKGVKIESLDPLVITTYDDQFYLDAEWMVKTWFPAESFHDYSGYGTGNAPWQTLSPAIRAEAAGQLAFSQAKSSQMGVEWTNYIEGSSLGILETWMNQSANENYIPYAPTMSQYVTPEEATARWVSLQNWYTSYHHFWLGSGPFYLQQVTFAPNSMTMAHFDGYPDAAGRWDFLAAPAQPVIEINHPSGAPGSFFNLTGMGFPPSSQAYIISNNHIIGQLQVDSTGAISFTLSTENVTPGDYHLRVSVNPSAGLLLTLDNSQPTWPREGELPVVALPTLNYFLLPIVSRN